MRTSSTISCSTSGDSFSRGARSPHGLHLVAGTSAQLLTQHGLERLGWEQAGTGRLLCQPVKHSDLYSGHVLALTPIPDGASGRMQPPGKRSANIGEPNRVVRLVVMRGQIAAELTRAP